MGDSWKKIRGSDQYFINRFGAIVQDDSPFVIRVQPVVAYMDNSGYLKVDIPMQPDWGGMLCIRLHRLVAEYFLEGYEPGCLLNFKDGNKGNVHVDNIEMVKTTRRRAIICIDNNKVYSSVAECAKIYKCNPSNIVECCKSKRKSVAGRRFAYYEDEKSVSGNPFKVVETGQIFESQSECARALGLNRSSVTKCLRGDLQSHKGYHFEYLDL